MRFLLSIVLMFGMLATVPARGQQNSSSNQTEIVSEEYKVYDAVLGEMFAGNRVTFDFGGKVPVKLLVIEERTVSYPTAGQEELGLGIAPSLHVETLSDYRTKNQQPATLKRLLTLTVDYALVNSPESRRAAAEREDSPVHGVVTLSRVGFNKARTEAFVYMMYDCGGGLCGKGLTLLLVKNGEAWKIDKKMWLWVS